MATPRNPLAKQYVYKKFDPIDLAYFAGIIDGEGCFFICLRKPNSYDGYIGPNYRGQLTISNTDFILMKWLDKTLHDISSATTRATSSKNFERLVYTWTCTGFRLLDICKQVLPYLKIKKSHCENMIRFRETFPKEKCGRGNKRITQDIIDIRQDCLNVSRSLNTRFHLHPLKHN